MHRAVNDKPPWRAQPRPVSRSGSAGQSRYRPWPALVYALIWLCFGSANVQAQFCDQVFQDRFENQNETLQYIAAWVDDADGNGFNDVRGISVGSLPFELRLNDNPAGEQRSVQLAMAGNGDFVVVWANSPNQSSEFDIYLRGFNADGSERFSTRQINVENDGEQIAPDVAMAANGDFVVVWADDKDGNGFFQIRGRGYFANGTQKFGDSTLNNIGAGDQLDPVVAMADDGRFVVAWADDQDNDKIFDISARRFSASGSPQGAQFYVSAGEGLQAEPALAVGPEGAFVIAWRDDNDLNFYSQIVASAFDASGTARFTGRTLNSEGRGNQYQPAVAMQDDGGFIATWIDQGQQVMARIFGADGTPQFEDRIVNQDRFRPHSQPDVGVAEGGQFLVVWEELSASGHWRLRGQSLTSDGDCLMGMAIASERGGDQRAPVVAIR